VLRRRGTAGGRQTRPREERATGGALGRAGSQQQHGSGSGGPGGRAGAGRRVGDAQMSRTPGMLKYQEVERGLEPGRLTGGCWRKGRRSVGLALGGARRLDPSEHAPPLPGPTQLALRTRAATRSLEFPAIGPSSGRTTPSKNQTERSSRAEAAIVWPVPTRFERPGRARLAAELVTASAQGTSQTRPQSAVLGRSNGSDPVWKDTA
jgi:hypothetical protein